MNLWKRLPSWLTALLGAGLAAGALWALRVEPPAAPLSLSRYLSGTYQRQLQPGEAQIRLDTGQTVTAVTYAEAQPTPGQAVVLNVIDGQYVLEGPRRFPLLGALLGLTLLVALTVTGVQGLRAVLGSALTLAALWLILLPLLLGGAPVLGLLPALGAVLTLSVYFVHGWNRKSHAALLALLLCVTFGAVLLSLLVGAASLTGLSDAGATVAQASYGVSAAGLYMVGVLLTSLGAMNDVAITQTSTVETLAQARPVDSRRALFQQAMRVGRDHAAGMVNVLMLLYAGGSLPLLLLLRASSGTPLWVQANSEGLFAELAALLLALVSMLLVVPVSTALAASWMSGSRTHGRPPPIPQDDA